MSPLIFTLAILSVTLNALAQVTLRKAMLSLKALPPAASQFLDFGISLALNRWLLAGMACYAVSIGVWLIVLSKAQVSLAYPLLSIGYIIAAVIGYYWLGENVSFTRASGIALICVGIVFVSRSA